MAPRIIVRLTMKPEHNGGRHAPFTEGYRPHFVIGDGEWLSVTAVHCHSPVAPGEIAEVEFELAYHPQVDYSALAVGATFAMHEGAKVVATGTVLSRYDHFG